MTSRLLLGLLLLRAYVPVGFMPAGGHPFQVELCSAALSMEMPAMPGMSGMPGVSGMPGMPGMPGMAEPHPHHPGSHSIETCPFGSAPAAAPLSHLDGFSPAGPIKTAVFGAFTPLLAGARLERAHQPRGPPAHP